MIHNKPQAITATKTQESTNSLRKDKMIQLKKTDGNKWNTVTLVIVTKIE